MSLQAVVLGYYDFSSSLVPRGYTSYYLAALRWLQHEPSGAVAWGVVTNPQVAQAFSLSTSQSIHLVLWNTTLVRHPTYLPPLSCTVYLLL